MKHRLLGHWGASPALSFVWVHLNRLKHDLDVIFVAGRATARPACSRRPTSKAPTRRSTRTRPPTRKGMRKFFKQFSFPGHIGSHVTPETPGSIHEGGELGYSLARVRHGVRQPRPHRRLRRGRRRSRDRATRDVVALQQVHEPSAGRRRAADPQSQRVQDREPDHLARISREELEALFLGYGYKPYFVEGSDPTAMHQKMADTLERAIDEIRAVQRTARQTNAPTRPRGLVIVLRSPRDGPDRRRSMGTS